MAPYEEQIPTELIDKWASYFPPSGVVSFRKTCEEATMHTLESALRPVFTTWNTSLMGSSLENLKSISNDDHIRDLIETLVILDDTERLDPFASTELLSVDESYDIWPRNSADLIITSEIALSDLQIMLQENKFPRLQKLKIRDYTISPQNFQLCDETLYAKSLLTARGNTVVEKRGVPTPMASFAKDILESATADLVLTSLQIQYAWWPHSKTVLSNPRFMNQDGVCLTSPRIYEATIEFIANGSPPPQPQPKELRQFSRLCSAKIALGGDDALTTYWLDRILSTATMLQTLELTFSSPFASLVPRERSAAAPRLKEFKLRDTQISAQDIMAILSSSKASLVDITFRQVTLPDDGSTWASLLTCIAKEFPALESFQLTIIREKARGYLAISYLDRVGIEQLEKYREGLSPVEKGTGINRRITTIGYRGEEAGIVLRILAGDGVVGL